MKFLIFISTLMIASLSFGSDGNEQTEVYAKGKIKARVWYRLYYREYLKNKLQSIQAELSYTLWGEGKIRGVLTFKGALTCPIERVIPFIGLDNGFGEFDLYSKSNDLVNSGQEIASMVKFNNEISINLPAGKGLVFVEKNLCQIGIPADASIVLKIR